MTKTQQLEQLRGLISQHQAAGEHDRARELAHEIPALERESEEERARLRAETSPLRGLADAIAAAPSPRSAWVEEPMSAERLARRAALNPMLAQADAIRAAKKSR